MSSFFVIFHPFFFFACIPHGVHIETKGLKLQLNFMDPCLVNDLDIEAGQVDEETRFQFLNAFAQQILGLIKGQVLLVITVHGSQSEVCSVSVSSVRNLN